MLSCPSSCWSHAWALHTWAGGGGGGGCIFPVGSSLYEVGRRDGERRGGPGAPLIACRAPHVPQGTAAVATAAAADNANK